MEMITFTEFLEGKRVTLYGIGKNNKKDTPRKPNRLGVTFKAVNPFDLGMPVVWKMNAGRIGYRSKRNGQIS